MPIDNRIFALARRAPRANRAPVNEYAGLGQGLQQLGQGLNTLITTQWRLHVRNESASLDNWLTEQMGILQIEAVKQSKNPEEQMAHWQAGVIISPRVLGVLKKRVSKNTAHHPLLEVQKGVQKSLELVQFRAKLHKE